MVEVRRFDIVIVALDPTVGSEMQKTRPCVVLSPDEMNASLRTALIAPMTTQGRAYSWRVPVQFQWRSGRIALDQIRAVDGARFSKPVGRLDAPTARRVLDVLADMFAQ